MKCRVKVWWVRIPVRACVSLGQRNEKTRHTDKIVELTTCSLISTPTPTPLLRGGLAKKKLTCVTAVYNPLGDHTTWTHRVLGDTRSGPTVTECGR